MEGSKKCQQEQGKDLITTVIKSKAGCTVMIEHITEIPGDESARREKVDDESRERPEMDVTTQEEFELEQEPHHDDELTDDDEDVEDEQMEEEQPVVEFEDPAYEISQSYEMEDEYESCLLYTSPSPRDATLSRMPSSA